ncbi:MAG: YicC family protein [Bacteroidales bacterium]|nr:YicC family protein [Bacteroidales bacterium]
MIKSMTGYGKAAAELVSGGSLIVEIRTLNGKSADINIKSNLLPKDEELLIRQKLAAKLQRGTIDVFLTVEQPAGKGAQTIDKDLVRAYYNQVGEVAGELGVTVGGAGLLETVLRFPDVLGQKRSELISEEDIPAIEKAFDEAIAAVDDYRSREGAVLYKDVLSRVDNILSLYDEVESYEKERIEAVRAKLTRSLEELSQKVDPQRFEQEMVFYLEKLDINEEKVRLRQHCKYFRDTIDGEPYPGKKLGFIIQEMGREINTTGSKANHAGIQKCVVRMKDELEKMREQSMNIL